MWILYTQIYLMRKIENYKFDFITVKLWSFNIIENCTYQHISLVPTLFLTSLSFHIPVIYVSRSCYNKTPQPEWFTQKKHIVFQVCKVDIWDHNVGRCGCSFWGLWEDHLVHASCLASDASMSNSWPLSCIVPAMNLKCLFELLTLFGIAWLVSILVYSSAQSELCQHLYMMFTLCFFRQAYLCFWVHKGHPP